MPTLTRIEGFEHRALSIDSFGTSVDGVGICDAVGAGTSIDTATFRSGSASLKVLQDGISVCNIQVGFTGTTVVVGSLYIRLTAAPATESRIIRLPGPSNSLKFIVQTDGKINTTIVSNGTAGPTVTDSTWHRLDFRHDTSTTTHTCDWAVDGTAQTQNAAGGQTAGQNMTDIELGSNQTSANATVWYDDVVLSTTSGDYPLGEHKVLSLIPDADGTHNAGTNIIEDNAGADIGAVPAWSLLEEVPGTTTDYVTQVAVGSGNYAEVGFGNTSETTIWGVIGLAVLGGTTAGDGAETRILDSASTLLETLHTSTGNASPVQYKVKMIPAPGGTWDQSEVNGLKARVGFAEAATGGRWYALQLQYAAVEAAPAGGGIVDPFGMSGFFGA